MSHDGAAGHFVSLSVSPDSASVFRNFPDRQELFLKVHPAKSYYGYREMAEAVAKMVGAMVFRVDSAIWK